ncbi:polysaccharide biosynthesis tyrosine autokinase [Sphingomonas sp.]|uniref:GumC family protein n=1 Tax=Sphingomonas sp. TaxID=28214 RepID=UPI00184E5364|nr:polysaccharide biosynthesis tyrosine autokinase [Sphingomonas sp.]MBA3511194.1 polysaccharide biosynthesis tyrosine autokinase [Sphingomonas sp.]
MNDYLPPPSLPALPQSGGELAIPHYDATGFAPLEQEESTLRHYWRILYKRRYLVLALTALGLAAGIFISMMTRPEYAGTVMVQVAREEAKVLNIEGVEQDGGGTRFDAEFYQTQYALLKSRSLSELVVRDLGLADNPLFLADFDETKVDQVRALPRAQRFAMATKAVNKNTMVTPIRLSSIINVTYNSPNPQMAATIANAIARHFVESNLTRRYEAAAYARQFLQTRLNQVRARLEESERKAVQYAQQQGLIKIRTGQGEAASEQSILANDLASLSDQLALARAQRAQAEAQYRAGTGGNIAAQSLGNVTLTDLRRERAELLGQLSKLESDFGPEYPTVVALRSQISELERQMAREEGRVSSSVTQDLGGRYRQALATERSIQARVDGLKSQLLGEQGRSIQFNIIQRDVDTNRALYDALLQRFKEVGIAGGIGTNNISIVDKALPPARPFKPNLPLNLAVGLILGLLLGAAAAVVLENMEDAALQPGDVHRKLGVPLLGVTPRQTGEVDVLATLREPKSPLAEAYFSILTSLQFSTPHGTPKSIMFTSAQAQEGKSTSSLALALSLVSVGARVLLIDADMRNPSIHKIFGKSLGAGLSNLLTGNGQLTDHMQDSSTPNLSILMAGQIPPNPAELLSAEAIVRLIDEAAKRFDHIVVDGPPVLGLADAPLLSRAVEATVLVVEAGRTPTTRARHAIERLFGVRTHVIGAVLTKFDLKTTGYGYGYGYGYEYQYGRTENREPALANKLGKLLSR